jgi:hypothetical protein
MKKARLLPAVLIAAVLFAVFFKMFTLEQAFLSGDHREQQYPWAKFYQEEIHKGRLPWWTTYIHCGFPLLAEGQVGAFYPLNFIFFFLFPTKIAYNYIILFHYWLGGLLFYAFLRRNKLSIPACLFATAIYLFGSTQGGYFYYNYISQKVVIWLPLTLILIDLLRERRNAWDIYFLGVVFAVQIFGGYLQVAVYSIFYSCLYFIYRWWERKNAEYIVRFISAGALGIAISLVQLAPTYELSLLSVRGHAEKGLAYVGSMTPAGFATLFYPSWDAFLGSEMYIGLLGLFFLFAALFSPKMPREKFFIFAAVLFLLFALGKFSPVYRLIIETTEFHSFRTPIKFLFFVTFSLAVLAGFGFHKVFTVPAAVKFRHAAGLYAALVIIMLGVSPGVHHLLGAWRGTLLPSFENYVVQQYHGQAGHPHTEDRYREKARFFYDAVHYSIGPEERDTHRQYIFLALSLLLLAVLLRLVKRKPGTTQMFCALFLLADLYAYGGTSIRTNLEPFSSIDAGVKSPIVKTLKSEKARFRVMEVYQEPAENAVFPVFPSSNMIDHIEDIGAYSPLIVKAYRDLLKGWGYTNDSLAVSLVNPKLVLEKLPELGALNVRYVLSAVPLDSPDLRQVQKDGKVRLYQNSRVRSRAVFLPGKSVPPASLKEVATGVNVPLASYDQQSLEIRFDAPENGVLIVSDLYYPGWTVSVDGRQADLVRAGEIFRAVRLQEGSHIIRMEYKPRFFFMLGYLSLGFLLGIPLILAGRAALAHAGEMAPGCIAT